MQVSRLFLSIFLLSTVIGCGASGQGENSSTAQETAGPAESESGFVENPGMIPSSAGLEFSTDFSRTVISFEAIMSGGPPKDGIPSIDSPEFVTMQAADEWIGDKEAVLVLRLQGKVRVYPLQILMWHEIVNDSVDGVPVAVTYCPLCNTGITFRSRIDGRDLDFGTTGRLRYSNLIMYDRQSETWWQQASGRGLIGEYAGRRLEMLPVALLPWNEVKATYGQGRSAETAADDTATDEGGSLDVEMVQDTSAEVKVLSKNTGYSRPYGQNPYQGYDSNETPFLYAGPEIPDKYEQMERVLAVRVEDDELAFAYEELQEEKVVEREVGGRQVVVFWEAGTASALDAGKLSGGRDVGTAQAYFPAVEDEASGESSGRMELSFYWDGDSFRDEETGSTWSVTGRATGGPLEGAQLESPVTINHFWFSWSAFQQ